MRTVSVDGIVYTKAKEVARDFGYTADYLGQLCRSGKIECQLVGRAWYVSVDSVELYRSNKQMVAGGPPIIPTNVVDTDTPTHGSFEPMVERVAVRPVLSKNAIRSLFHEHQQRTFSNYSTPKYIPDDADLLPQSRAGKSTSATTFTTGVNESDAAPTKLSVVQSGTDKKESASPTAPEGEGEVELEKVLSEETGKTDAVEEAETTLVPVKNITRQKKFSFTPVPEVPLRGKIPVRQVEYDKPKILPRIPPLVSAAGVSKKQTIKLTPAPATNRPPLEESSLLPSARPAHRVSKVNVAPSMPAAGVAEKVTFSPSTVAKKQIPEPDSFKGLTLPQAIFLAATVVVFFVLTLISFFGATRLEIDNTSGGSKNTLYLDFTL